MSRINMNSIFGFKDSFYDFNSVNKPNEVPLLNKCIEQYKQKAEKHFGNLLSC